MGKWLKRSAWLAGVFVVAMGALGAVAWWHSERALATVHAVQDPSLVFVGDEAEATRGAHLYAVLGCVDCHGADARGKFVFDAMPKRVLPSTGSGEPSLRTP